MIRLRAERACLAALVVIAMAACVAPRVQAVPGCGTGDVAARPWGWPDVEKLAGSWQTTMTGAGLYPTGRSDFRMVLTVNDSVHRFLPMRVGYFPGERPLAGYIVDGKPGSTPQSIVMIKSDIWLGGFDQLDGAGYKLQPKRIGRDGFSGTWEWEGGGEVIVDTATGKEVETRGEFCAVRSDSRTH